jgi:NADH:ubiquinone oxidoreductase subunit F (NADH-binding)
MSEGDRLPRLTAGIARGRLAHAEHVAVHGPLPDRPHGLIDAVAAAALRGRGGAAFPTATKLAAVAGRRGRKVVVVNGAEGEPMSRKDRVLLDRAPHLVLDGAQCAAQAVGAREVIVAVPQDAARARASLADALGERVDVATVRVVGVPRRYLAGEESALVQFLSGGELKPTLTPPRPDQRGVSRRPTLVQNAETLAHVALIARHGPAWFRALGTADRPGSALATLSGAVARPGVYELAVGTPLGRLVELAGGLTEPARAVLVGGYFGRWVDWAPAQELALDAPLGSGVICVLGASACPAAELARATAWLAGETAGQCGPCVHGLSAVADGIAHMAGGGADALIAARVERWAGQVEGRGACHHPNGVVRFARSGLQVFARELDDHRRHGPCDACDRPRVLGVFGPATDAQRERAA